MARELTTEERIKLAVSFIEQSPPGEVNDVVNDIRAIIGDDDALMPHVLPAMHEYNLSQLSSIEHAADGDVPAHTSILSEALIVPGTDGETVRFVDHDGKRHFTYDPLTMTASDFQPYELPEDEEAFRSSLAASLGKYVTNHYPAGLWSVSCSQIPLVQQQSVPADAGAAAATGVSESAEPATPEAESPSVTGSPSGAIEEPPTPAVDEREVSADEEVDAPGAVDKLDEDLEEVQKAENEAEAAQGVEGEAGTGVVQDVAEGAGAEDGAVIEEGIAVEEGTVAEETQPPVAEREPEATPADEDADVAAATASVAQLSAAPVQERIENPVYTLEVVGNRYNPANYWTGRWRTRWVVDPSAAVVKGTIRVDVHYYEQGNVQLATNHEASFPLPAGEKEGQNVASQIVTAIAKIETEYQFELKDVYDNLGERTFRSLRRALPVTRQKIDWEKVGGYTLGADLSKARAA